MLQNADNFSVPKFYLIFLKIILIRMQHWRPPATDGAEFWISCKRPAILSSFSYKWFKIWAVAYAVMPEPGGGGRGATGPPNIWQIS